MKVKTPQSPPYCLTSKKTIWITNRRSYFLARRTGRGHYELQEFHCQRKGAVPILLLHTLRFQLPEIQLTQWHHHCSNAKSHSSSTNHASLTVHHPPRRCRYTSLVETRMFHNPSPVQIRTFPNTKRQLLRSRKGPWRQLYSQILHGQYHPMTSTRRLEKLRNSPLKLRMVSGH